MSDATSESAATQDADVSTGHDDLSQVILYNDDVNTMEYVVGCLARIFRHPFQLARKIMIEAHRRGRAVAEVEAEPLARRHKADLVAAGLRADIEAL